MRAKMQKLLLLVFGFVATSMAIAACGELTREHAGASDLTDVLVASAALIALGPDAKPDEIAFPGMPAARRLGLDSAACSVALAESRDEIQALRQALNV